MSRRKCSRLHRAHPGKPPSAGKAKGQPAVAPALVGVLVPVLAVDLEPLAAMARWFSTRRLLRQGARLACLLCDSDPASYVGVWTPANHLQGKVMAASDECRSVGFRLCARCAGLPDAQVRVEVAILAEFDRMAE